jgi:hypothetical protein
MLRSIGMNAAVASAVLVCVGLAASACMFHGRDAHDHGDHGGDHHEEHHDEHHDERH